MRKKMILNGQPVEISADVENPVRGILTQAEFDALTEEQKASGTYFVDDGAACPCGEVYSTEERRIGTWIDGQPLYRRTWQNLGAADLTNDSAQIVIPEYTSDIHIISYFGYATRNADHLRASLPGTISLILLSGNVARVIASGAFGTYNIDELTLTYTKTTDSEVSE